MVATAADESTRATTLTRIANFDFITHPTRRELLQILHPARRASPAHRSKELPRYRPTGFSHTNAALNNTNCRLQAFSAWSWLYIAESGGHQPC